MKIKIISTPKWNTLINHNIRVELGITNDMYVFLDCIEKLVKVPEAVSYESIIQKTGFDKGDLITLFNDALSKGFIHPVSTKTKFDVTERWTSSFMPEEAEFEKFWEPIICTFEGEKKKVSWTGARFDAKAKYIKLRKEESYEYLLKQKTDYFQMIAESDWRKVMGASVFLNSQTKRYAEDWTQYGDKTKVVEKKKSLSKKDVTNLFA